MNCISKIICCLIRITSTDNNIGDTGATSLSEVLKSNTTLAKLNLSCEDKGKKTHKRLSSTIHSSPLLFTLTDSKIGDTGATSLSESLKSNATLTELNLSCQDKRRHTKDIHQQFTLFFLSTSTANQIGDTGITSLNESLKSNTTLTALDLSCEDKEDTPKASINNSFFFFSLHTNREQHW